MTAPGVVRDIRRGWDGPVAATVTLDYAGRVLRRRRLAASDGRSFVVDLARTASVDEGDAFLVSDGALIGIRAATEALALVTGPELPRYAWHIGNRHAPCQIGADRLVIQRDPVMGAMLEGLGATVTPIEAPFTPEGGAYGHGRTHGHDHA